ncbi:MAG: hypothetical protein M5U14_19960 [Acidimicrobiia bacterium]|nr:hypothetical protein [Acidimicrobiia bacterium]
MADPAGIPEELTTALRGVGSHARAALAEALPLVADRLDPAAVRRWVELGARLGRRGPGSEEPDRTATALFLAGPGVLDRLGHRGLSRWVELASELADRSAAVAAAFVAATPDALPHLGPDDLEAWAAQGRRLCRGTRASAALAARHFRTSPALLGSVAPAGLERVARLVDALAERSPETATAVLEQLPPALAGLEGPAREAFLTLAEAVAGTSWSEALHVVERAPELLAGLDPGQRARFCELATGVVNRAGPAAAPLLVGAASALGSLATDDQAETMDVAVRLIDLAPAAAMEWLCSAPRVRERLGPAARRWAEIGIEQGRDHPDPAGAEAWFRLESARATETLVALSARVDLGQVADTLRVYAQALAGQRVAVRSTEDLVERGIGWVSQAGATTEGAAVYLPPFVEDFGDRHGNFLVYKVAATHQAGRLEFGSFRYRYGVDGALLRSTVDERQPGAATGRPAAVVPVQRFLDLFPDRLLAAGLLALVEDARVDARIAAEYAGIRGWLHRLQSHEAERRPPLAGSGLRQAFVENLVRISLGRPDTVRWPASLMPELARAASLLRTVEDPAATVQDSAEVAAALSDLAGTIPNLRVPVDERWVVLDETPPGEGVAAEAAGSLAERLPSGGEEVDYEHPPPPGFRGDFKPEIVQLLTGELEPPAGEGEVVEITAEQLRDLLERSTDVVPAGAEELDATARALLEELERTVLEPAGPAEDGEGGSGDEEDEGEGDAGAVEHDDAPEIEWFSYDEWDFRAHDYRPGWCRVGQRPATASDAALYEETLRAHHALVLETRRQFELLRPEAFRLVKRLEDGHEIDLDQAVQFHADRAAGAGPLARFYSRRDKTERDVAVALLLDLSASTDEEIEPRPPAPPTRPPTTASSCAVCRPRPTNRPRSG